VASHGDRYPRIAAGTVLGLAAAFSLIAWRSGQGFDANRLVNAVPRDKGVLFYVDVAQLRSAGLLKAFAGSAATEEPDYRKFVHDTGFDYTKDLDAAAVTLVDGNSYAAVRGSFQWKRLSDYAIAQGGTCVDQFCKMPANEPGRFISFYPLRGNVLALAVSREERGVEKIGLAGPPSGFHVDGPIVISAPGFAFENVSGLPPGAQAFLSPLAKGTRASFSVKVSSTEKMDLRLDAETASPEIAKGMAKQLQMTTELLKNMLAREKMTPTPEDLSGVLVAGAFVANDSRVVGSWPLDHRFVEGLFSAK
jgi:hypothetical protein